MLRLLGLTRRVTPEFEHRVLVLGPASASAVAMAVSAGAHRRLPPLFGSPRLSRRAIWRAIAAERATLVHVWDSESCAIAVASHPREAVAATLGAVPPRAMPTPLAQDRAEALCLGDRARRQALAAGWLHARVHTAQPPSESVFHAAFGAVGETGEGRSRQQWRDEWGVDDETVVVGVVGDPWTSIDARLAFDMAGRAWLAGHRVRLVMDPRVAAATELRRWASFTRLHEVLIESPIAATPWQIFDALDAVLLPEASFEKSWRRMLIERAPGGAPSNALALRWAIDAGLPAITTRAGPLDGLAESTRFTTVHANPNDGARALRALLPRHPDALHDAARSDEPAADRSEPRASAPRSAQAWADAIRGLYGRAAVAAGLPRTPEMSAAAAS